MSIDVKKRVSNFLPSGLKPDWRYLYPGVTRGEGTVSAKAGFHVTLYYPCRYWHFGIDIGFLGHTFCLALGTSWTWIPVCVFWFEHEEYEWVWK